MAIQKKRYLLLVPAIIAVIIGSVLFVNNRVASYDSNTAHPSIAGQGAKLFNRLHEDRLSQEQIEWITKGAILEDTPIRWLNHFYDPVNDIGLKGKYLSSKDWVENQSKQAEYVLGDKTWQQALHQYKQGNYEESFTALGHVLHLIADLAVPAHTRDDVHIIGNSYEQFIEDNPTLLTKFDFSGSKGEFKKLGEIFSELASYTNKNFYSDDTIESNKYLVKNVIDIPISNDSSIAYAYSEDDDGQEYKLYAQSPGSDWNPGKWKTIADKFILHDYASLLIPRAVNYSQEVIELFFKEVNNQDTFDDPEVNGISAFFNGLISKVAGGIISNLFSDKKIDLTNENKTINNVKADAVDSAKKIQVSEIISSSIDVNKKNDKQVESEESIDDTVAIITESVNEEHKILHIMEVKDSSYEIEQDTSSTMQAIDSIKTTVSLVAAVELSDLTNTGSSVLLNQFRIPEVKEKGKVVDDELTISLANNTSSIDLLNETNTSSSFSNYESSLATSLMVDPVNVIPHTSTTEEAEGAVTTTSLDIIVSSTIVVAKSVTSSNLIVTSTHIGVVSSTVSTTVEVQTSTPTFPVHAVVISQIAWAGTGPSSSADEWLELYNNSNQVIDLRSWKLYLDNKEILFSNFDDSEILANSTYLLERTDDNSFIDRKANAIFKLRGGLKNSGMNLRLLDGQGTVIDQVDCSQGWFAGNNVSYQTMERIDLNSDGSSSSNWRDGIAFYQVESSIPTSTNINHPFLAVPVAPFMIPDDVILDGRQKSDKRVLKKELSPYILRHYYIPAGKSLIAEAGVVIKSEYKTSYIEVSGELELRGGKGSPVVMTSGRDSSFSDYNLDEIIGAWDGTAAQKQDWQGIWFKKDSKGVLENSKIKYAGSKFRLLNNSPANQSQVIRSEGASILIADSGILQGGDYLLYTDSSSTTIRNSQFDQGEIAIKHVNGQHQLSNLEIKNISNKKGVIDISGSWPRIDKISFENSEAGIKFANINLINQDIVLGSEYDYFFGNLVSDEESAIKILAGSKIFLEPYATWEVMGGMSSEGTVEQPVNMGLNNSWGFISFKTTTVNMRNTVVSGGGAIPDDKDCALEFSDSFFSCHNCQLGNSRVPGKVINSYNSVIRLTDSQLAVSSLWPQPIGWYSSYSAGIKAYGSDIHLDNTTFRGFNYGIFKAPWENKQSSVKQKNMSATHYFSVDKNIVW